MAQEERQPVSRNCALPAGMWVIALFAMLLTTSCVSLADPETSQVHEREIAATLQAGGEAVGQTLVSRRSGLDSLTLWLSSNDPKPQGSLVFELFHSPEDITPLFQTELPTGDVQGKKAVKITFPAQDDPPGQAYYLRLRAVGKNLEVYGRLENIYLPGDIITNPSREADLAFRTTYRYGWDALWEDLLHWGKYAWLVIPLGLFLLVPGWLLLDLAGGFHSKDFGAWIAMVVGISMAVVPVIMLWTTVLNLPWSSSAVWIALILLTGIQIARHWKNIRLLFNRPIPSQESPSRQKTSWMKKYSHPMFLLILFIVTLFTRMVMVRDAATPLWVDSVHHGLITRLILNHGNFPATFAPYLSIQPTEYHPGFHSLAASLVWLTGLEIDQALLVLGQVLSSLAVFSSYLFTVSLVKNRTAGLAAAALTGLFTPMPAYYASWGRYTHLAGMLVLPVFLTLFIQFLDLPPARKNPNQTGQPVRERWYVVGQSLLLCLVAAGLFLLHYRVATFGLLLALAALFLQPRSRNRPWRKKWMQSFLAALGTLMVTAPWILPFIQHILLPRLETTGTRQPLFGGFAWQYLTSGSGTITLILALFGLILGISLRRRFAFLLVLWMALLFLLPNLSAFGLPGGYLVNHTAVEISLYLPISLLGGYALSFGMSLLEKMIPRNWQGGTRLIILLIAIFFGFLGAQKIVPLLNPITFLSRQADQAAITWINENLPADGTFAINPFLWGYGFYAGSDGGYWLSPLTGHLTLPPPVLYGASSLEERDRINYFCEQVMANGKDAQELWHLFQQNNVQYVFLGAKGGEISPQVLGESERFHLLYAKEGAWIYEVMP